MNFLAQACEWRGSGYDVLLQGDAHAGLSVTYAVQQLFLQNGLRPRFGGSLLSESRALRTFCGEPKARTNWLSLQERKLGGWVSKAARMDWLQTLPCRGGSIRHRRAATRWDMVSGKEQMVQHVFPGPMAEYDQLLHNLHEGSRVRKGSPHLAQLQRWMFAS